MRIPTVPPKPRLRGHRRGPQSSAAGLWLLTLSLSLLTACATPLCVAPGTPEAQVRARFGSPAAEYRLSGGKEGTRLEYDTGWVGQRIYMVDFGSDGRAVKTWQTLTAEHFAQIRIGADTADSVRREFGRPWRVDPSPLGHGQTIWEYPYYEASAWNSLMSITFDATGVVRNLDNGQDPRFIVNK